MLVLALDTATPASTAALVEVTADGITGVVERRTVDPRAHGEKLAPEIAAVLAAAGARPGDLAAIVAGVGPGPFTGLRVGLATAAAMGQALGVPTYGVCSLDAIGRAAGPGRVLVATDARRREVYLATYADGERATGPAVARPADVAALLSESTAASDERMAASAERMAASAERTAASAERTAASAERTAASAERTAASAGAVAVAGVSEVTALGALVDRAAGEGALKYQDVLGVPVNEDLRYPAGADLVALAATRIRAAAVTETLTPLYLRRPDAVEPAGRKPVLT